MFLDFGTCIVIRFILKDVLVLAISNRLPDAHDLVDLAIGRAWKKHRPDFEPFPFPVKSLMALKRVIRSDHVLGIKLVRDLTNWGLVEAKDFAEFVLTIELENY